MDIKEILGELQPPVPWKEGDNIPWNDSQFSGRMLNEHLSQDHDKASRRLIVVDRQVEWIHANILDKKDSDILDLGCGPGLYTEALTKKGHRCVGVDYSPASIEYAKNHALKNNLEIKYFESDMRKFRIETNFDLVMFVFGEFNSFSKSNATLILEKICELLKPDGRLLLECHTYEYVRKIAKEPEWNQEFMSGLFSDRPHIWHQCSYWDSECQAATTRYNIIDTETYNIEKYVASTQAYTKDDYVDIILNSGFNEVNFLPSLDGGEPLDGLQVIVAK